MKNYLIVAKHPGEKWSEFIRIQTDDKRKLRLTMLAVSVQFQTSMFAAKVIPTIHEGQYNLYCVAANGHIYFDQEAKAAYK